MKLFALLSLLPLGYGMLCPALHYWENEKESCQKCSKCHSNQITARPCQVFQDTQCDTISSLPNFALPPIFKNHHKKNVFVKTVDASDDDDDIYKDIFSKHPENFENHHKKQKANRHRTNKKHYSFNQINRINDKFLDFDKYDEDNFKVKHPRKHLPEIRKNHHKGEKHHFTFESYTLKDDDKPFNSREFFNNEKNSNKFRGNNHKKSVKLSHIEDENMLEEWLIQSRKQLKLKKDDLLKTLKEEKSENEDEDKKVKLNYPLHGEDLDLDSSDHHSVSHKEKSTNPFNELDEQMFKELIKNDETREMDLSTLLSNKREPYGYKSATPSHRLFLGEPSTISEIIGQVKDPQEVIKEEMGRNIIYEKSKFSVVPIVKGGEDDVISVPFTAAERFVWDWQAVALCSAVFACLVFFLEVAAYSIINARQWKRVKRNYNTEIEEMSTRIALVQPTLESSLAESNGAVNDVENVNQQKQ